jgi:protein-disulfide isomerase
VDVSHLQSPYKLADHPGAPLQLKVFLDFQCPACKEFSKLIPLLKDRYQDNIDIQAFFYPLDPSCNPDMDHQTHEFACKAARIAVCSKDNFEEVHDDLFLNQESFSNAWLDKYAKLRGVADCVKSKATADELLAIILLSKPVKVPVTPTLVINGRRIRGGSSQQKLFDLMDRLLEKSP